ARGCWREESTIIGIPAVHSQRCPSIEPREEPSPHLGENRSPRLRSGSGFRGDGLARQLLQCGFADFEFLHLPGYSHGKFIDDFGDLEARNSTFAELPNLFRGQVRTFLHCDPSFHFFSVLGIGHSKYLCGTNTRTSVEEFLDFPGIDVLPAADYHVLRPTRDR